jgi:hypothetical protein
VDYVIDGNQSFSISDTLCVSRALLFFSLSLLRLLFLNNNHKRVLIIFVIIHLI